MPSAVDGEGTACVQMPNVGAKRKSFLGAMLISIDLRSKWGSTYPFIGSSLPGKKLKVAKSLEWGRAPGAFMLILTGYLLRLP